MKEAKNVIYICPICEEASRKRPTGGLACVGSVAAPILVCPSCGPIHWEVMQACLEATVRDLLN